MGLYVRIGCLQMEKVEDKKVSPYVGVIRQYISRLNSQIQSVPTLFNILSAQTVVNAQKVKDFVSKHGSEEKDEKGRDIIKMPIEFSRAFERLISNMNNSFQALDNVGRNAVVAMVSMYDAYLSSLVKVIYSDMPQLLNQSQKEFKLNNILLYKDFDELKEIVTEDEIESLLRKSHVEQLKWLEGKLDMPLTGFKTLPLFVELMERRNLFVHANGVVSRHYFETCEKYNIEIDEEVSLGKQLDATDDYVFKSYAILFQTGIMLGLVVWHKIRKQEGEELIDFLSEVCYDLIKEGHYDLAIVMIDFALDNKSFRKHINQASHIIFLVNKALSYHLKDMQKECLAIVEKLDLSAAEPVYKLAAAILKEDYDQAIGFMDQIGNIPKMRRDYKEWPLFTKFREEESFKNKYKELFNEDYSCLEVKKPEFEEILASAEKMIEQEEKTKTVGVKESYDLDGAQPE